MQADTEERTPQSPSDPTRERLLDEAERLFAEKGYAGVTIREITSAAGSNLAAVNYHFGGKHNLYMEVFRSRWIVRARRLSEPLRELAQREDLTVPTVISAVAHAFLNKPIKGEEMRRHALLMARESARPTEAFQLITAEVIRPTFELVCGLIRRTVPPEVSMERIKLITLSTIGQSLYFTLASSVVGAVMGQEYNQNLLNHLEDHITQLTVNGINGFNGGPAK